MLLGQTLMFATEVSHRNIPVDDGQTAGDLMYPPGPGPSNQLPQYAPPQDTDLPQWPALEYPTLEQGDPKQDVPSYHSTPVPLPAEPINQEQPPSRPSINMHQVQHAPSFTYASLCRAVAVGQVGPNHVWLGGGDHHTFYSMSLRLLDRSSIDR